MSAHRADELLRRSREARHPAAQQRRRDVHEPVACRRRGPDRTRRYGVDAAFSFFQNVGFGAYYARTETAGLHGDDDSYQGIVRLRRRSVRRAPRVPEGRRQLQSRGRLRPPRQFPPHLSRRRASARGPRRSRRCGKFTWQGSFDNFDERRRRARNADRDRDVQRRVRQQRPVFRHRARETTSCSCVPPRSSASSCPPGATSSPTRWCRYAFGAQRRVSGTVSVQAGQFYDGTLTAVGYSHRAHLGPEAVLARADHLDQPRRDAGQQRHHAAVPHARRLRLLAADVRERAAAVQLGRPAPSAATCASGGSTGPAASCSSSTPTSATPPTRARRADTGDRLAQPRIRGEDQPAAAITGTDDGRSGGFVRAGPSGPAGGEA